MAWALRLFGVRRGVPRKPPSRVTVCAYAVLAVAGLALLLVVELHGPLSALGAALVGSCGWSWFRGVSDRERAQRVGHGGSS